MPIEFRCSQCQQLLRVSTEAAAKQARCPECGAVSVVPRSETNASDLPPQDRAPQAQNSSPAGAGTEWSPSGDDPPNPYAAPAGGYAPPGPKTSGTGQIVATPADPGRIISFAWEVWKSNLGLLVGVSVVVFAVNLVVGSAQQAVTTMLQQDEVAAAIGVLLNIAGNLVQIFLGIGNTRIVLRLLRGQPAEFGDLFRGGPLFLSVLGASILAGVALVAGLLACVIPGLILAIIFWPFYWLIVDEKAAVIESFSMAAPLGKANAGTTIVLWLASAGIMIAGLLAFCVGLLFAAPLVSLIWGSAYLMMSGQLKYE